MITDTCPCKCKGVLYKYCAKLSPFRELTKFDRAKLSKIITEMLLRLNKEVFFVKKINIELEHSTNNYRIDVTFIAKPNFISASEFFSDLLYNYYEK